MTHVQGYGSWDEMVADQTAKENAANEGRLPSQIELQEDVENDRYWMQPYTEFLIFGHTWSKSTYAEGNKQYYDLDDPEDKAEYDQECIAVIERRERGYLFGRAYSTAEVDGELGDTHVSQVWPITKEAFEEAQAGGWQLVEVRPFDLDLMGEEAARKAGWTPLCNKALHEMFEAINNART